MWSKISSALKQREGNDSDADHSDAQSTRSPPPDPFRIDATTYYTQQAPPTPPSGVHSRSASREEDIIWSLRTQLALQQEMCAQFEIDLAARDKLVEALTVRLEASEKDNDKRKTVIRSWKKKAAELEKMCRHLEEEVDNSRQESMERSVMDEASGEALRQLHRQISQLEREKSEVGAERDALARIVERSEAEVARLRERLGTVDEAGGQVHQLQRQISQLRCEKSDTEVERNTLVQALGEAEAEIAQLRGELGVTDEAKVEAQRQLRQQVSQLEQFKADRASLTQAKNETEADIVRLNEEKLNIKTERDNFSSEISRLRAHVQQLQKDSAVMEVTIVQLNKQHDQDREDKNGLNIALESKQQELELVKRKHGARGTAGLTAGRTNSAPSIAGFPSAQPSKVLRTSAVTTRASSPVHPRIPSTLGRAANTRPPVANALRRASGSSVEAKIKASRRASIGSMPSEADDKENASIPVPLKHPRRPIVPA